MNSTPLNCNFTNDLLGFVTNHGTDYTNGSAMVLNNPDDVVKNVWHEVVPSEAYTIETRVKLVSHGQENGMKLERGHMRLMVYFYNGSINCVGADGSYAIKLDYPNDFNVLKFKVIGKTAFVYVNGVFRTVYPLGPFRSDSCLLTFFLRARGENAPSCMEVDYVKYIPEEPPIEIISPAEDEIVRSGENVTLKANILDAGIPYVDFYANGTLLGRRSAEDPTLELSNVRAGNFFITAKYEDTESIGTWLSVADGTVGEKPSVVCDRQVCRQGESVRFTLDIPAEGVKKVDYFVNALPASAEYIPTVYGKNVVSAKLLYDDGSYVLTDETPFTVCSEGLTGLEYSGNCILSYTAGCGTEILASDGAFLLNIKHTAEGVVYLAADGEKTYKLSCGAYRLHVDSGVCDVYFEEQFAFSFRMPITDKPNTIEAKEAADLVISGYNAARRICAPCSLASFSLEYALEFMLDAPRDFSLRLKDTQYQIILDAKCGKLMAKTYPNGDAGVVEDAELCTLPEGRHHYRIPVANGIAQLFIDNIWVSSLRLPTAVSSAAIDFCGIDSVCIRETNDLYVFEDNFDGKAELPSKAYYSVTDGVKAEFSHGCMTVSPSGKEDAEEYVTYLKGFANAPEITAKVCVDSADKGGLYIAARYTSKFRHLRAGYNFDEKCWQIVTVENRTVDLVASIPAEFPIGKEVTLGLKLSKNTAVLTVDGEIAAKSESVKFPFYGVVGIIAKDITVKVSHIRYYGTGRPIPGSATFLNEASTPEIFEYAPGNIYCIQSGRRMYESTDDGLTFEKVERPGYSNNTIRMASGTIVAIHRKTVEPGYVDYAMVSTDNGNTFEGPFPVQDYVINRITMNNKLIETSDGRLLFASGESGDGVEGEGGIRVFYSDDEGHTWKGSAIRCFDGTVVGGGNEARMDVHNTNVNCQESKVAEMPDGTLRLYVRTDEGFLYYSVSTDRGETWSAEMYTTPFISVLSAYNIELDPHTGDYYMAWEYNVKNDHKTIQYPRTRVALAVSRDKMKTWEYVADIDEVADHNGNFGHMNIGLKPTTTAVYVDAVKYNPDGNGKAPGKNYLVRVAKETMKTTARFTRPHIVSTRNITMIEEEYRKNVLMLSKDGKNAVFGQLYYEFSDKAEGYVPLTAVSKFVGAHITVNGASTALRIGDFETVFTAGSRTASVCGKDVELTAPTMATADGLRIPAEALSTVFGRKTVTASNGTVVSMFDRFGIANIEKLSETAVFN